MNLLILRTVCVIMRGIHVSLNVCELAKQNTDAKCKCTVKRYKGNTEKVFFFSVLVTSLSNVNAKNISGIRMIVKLWLTAETNGQKLNNSKVA